MHAATCTHTTRATASSSRRGGRRATVCEAAPASGPPPAWPGRAVAPPDWKPSSKVKKFSVLGSTGSIGTQTLDIAAEHRDRFEIVALSAGGNIAVLADQVRAFQPAMVGLADASKLAEFKELIKDVPRQPEIVIGEEGTVAVAAHKDADAVVTGIVGCAGLQPTCAAIRAGKDICLANKETLIAGGPAVLPLAAAHGVKILPADSEHSAIFQVIQGLPEGGLRRVILTASGGAFRDLPTDRLPHVTVADALKHPNWSMGPKITVDSATLMNKGLEVIEAHYLFGSNYDDIDVVIHPQSIIHSMVETADSSVLAQLGWPDMRLPILYTMSWPERVPCSEVTWPRLDFTKADSLTFKAPDRAKYPALDLAYSAGRTGGTATAVLSAANEVAVARFIEGEIRYIDIVPLVAAVLDEHVARDLNMTPDIEAIVHWDGWARVRAGELAGSVGKKAVLA